MATKVKTHKKPGSKSAQSKRPVERNRPAPASRTRSSAGKRPAPAARPKAAAKPASTKNKAARPAKPAAKPKATAKPAAKASKAPARKPPARPQADSKPVAKPERPAKPAAKAPAQRPTPVREAAPHPAKPAESAAAAPSREAPRPQDGKALANGAAKTAAAALKARVPGQENVRKLPERAPAPDAESFAEGDFVVYPTHGVGRVVAIETQQIAGISLPLIVITFDKDRMTLRVPVAKAHNSGLRKLSSRKVMDTALATLKGRSRVKRTMWSRRAQEYEAKINSGDPVSIAEVVRDLHRGSDQPDQSYSERQIYQAALDRLARELAAVERIDEQAAAQRLEEMLKAA
jgi:CarD family transcriptional regulator